MNRTTRSLAAASALCTLSVVGGCQLVERDGRGWWYCDPSGCYVCTPAGCDGLPDATSRDPLCAPGDDCTGSCADPGSPCGVDQNPSPICTVSAACRFGYVCTKGTCVPGKPGACATDEACGDGAFCNAGVCEDAAAPPPVTPSCASADSCADGFCASGACGSCPSGTCGGAATCLLDRHCGAGRVCLDGHCTASCSAPGSAAGCASGQTCKSSVCAPDQASCTSDGECGGSGAVCVNNRCYATCTASGACDNPRDLCSGAIETASFSVRICRPDDTAQLECQVSKDCSGGETCVNGVCRTACTGVEDCAACEDGPVCGPGGFCMTALESEPQCVAGGGCAAGLVCLGGQCLAL